MVGLRLTDLSSIPDPMPSWLWRVNIPSLINGLSLDPRFIEEIRLPFNNSQAEPRYSGGRRKFYPGIVEVGACEIVFYGDVNNTSANYLKTWREEIIRYQGGFPIYGLPGKHGNGYKKTIRWEMYSMDGNLVTTGKLIGCFPTEISELSLNYSSSDRIKFTQNFSVDASVFGEEDLNG